MTDTSRPFWVQRGIDSAANPVGVIDGSATGWVDLRGRTFIDGAPFSIDWAVRPGDEWRFAAAEPTVRQRLIGSMPMVETLVRVEGADIAQRVWGMGGRNPLGGEGWLIFEVRNESKLPIAAAVFVDGWTSEGLVPGDFSATPDAMWRAGAVVGIAQRRAAIAVAGENVGTELSNAAPEGAAPAATGTAAGTAAGSPSVGSSSVGSANAGLVWPLITEAAIQLAIPLPAPSQPTERRRFFGGRARTADPSQSSASGPAPSAAPEAGVVFPNAVPPIESVSAGWAMHVERAGSVAAPEPLVNDLLAQCTSRTLLLASSPGGGEGASRALARAALGMWGHSVGVGELRELDGLIGSSLRGRAALALALAAHCDFSTRDEEAVRRFDEELSPILAGCLRTMDREIGRGEQWGPDAVLVELAARWCGALFTRVGAVDGVDQASAIAARAAEQNAEVRQNVLTVDPATDPSTDLGALAAAALMSATPFAELKQLASAVQAVGGMGRGVDLAAWVLIAAHRGLVGLGPGVSEVRLGHGPMMQWVGQNWEVSSLLHPLAKVSYAVRWHGARPALLWELDVLPDATVGLVTSGLDTSFASQSVRGDALLQSPSGLAGVAPTEGESFD